MEKGSKAGSLCELIRGAELSVRKDALAGIVIW